MRSKITKQMRDANFNNYQQYITQLSQQQGQGDPRPPSPPGLSSSSGSSGIQSSMSTPHIEEPDFEENGYRYMFCYAPTSKADCGKCKQKIEAGKLKFGASQEKVMHAGFFWRHIECITVAQLTNVKSTYYKDLSADENIADYSRVPGFASLPPSEQERVKAVFAVLPETEAKQKKEEAEARAAKKAEEQEQAVRDWKAQLALGNLEKVTADVLKAILKHLGQHTAGNKKDLLQRLRDYQGQNDDSAAADKVDEVLTGGDKENATNGDEEQEDVPVQPNKKARIECYDV